VKRMVSAPWGADGSAGGAGSFEFGSTTGIGSGGSTLTWLTVGFLAFNSATTATIASSIGM
jgi:hypothetical protein